MRFWLSLGSGQTSAAEAVVCCILQKRRIGTLMCECLVLKCGGGRSI